MTKAGAALNALAGRSPIERVASIVMLVCLVVLAFWASERISLSRAIEHLFFAALPWTSEARDHPMAWASQALLLGLLVRLFGRRVLRWISRG